MAVRVTALYADDEHAGAVLALLLEYGFRRDQVAVVTQANVDRYDVADPALRRLLYRLDEGAVILSVRVGSAWPLIRDVMALNGAEAIATAGFAPAAPAVPVPGGPSGYSAHFPRLEADGLEVRRGTPVVGVDGVRLGAVDGLEEDALLVGSGDPADLDIHVPFDLIGSVADEEVRLTCAAAEILSRPWQHPGGAVEEPGYQEIA